MNKRSPPNKERQLFILKDLQERGVFPETIIEVGERLILELRKIMEVEPDISIEMMEEYIENVQTFIDDLKSKLKIPKPIKKH